MCFPRVYILCVLYVLLLSVVQPADGSEIIGGKEVVAHSLPHMALLKNKTNICGGTLIDARWVLTAAHCVGLKEVLLGVHDISNEKKESWQKVSVTHSFPHPCFDRDEAVNDLMLLKVLMSANVTVIDRTKCNSREHYDLKPVITKSMVCASWDGKKATDACQGDSGGPLLCNGALVGITSFGGTRCGDIKKPGVYSFLTEKHLNWINKTMKKGEML